MSLQPISSKEKNSVLLWIIGPSLPIVMVGSIVYGWVNIIWLPFIPLYSIIFLLGLDPRSSTPATAINWITKKIYYCSRIPIINFTFNKTEISDLSISSSQHYSKLRTWFFVCLVPLFLSITVSNFLHLKITNLSGDLLTSNASAIVAAVFFMPIFTILGIAISTIDSSNLFTRSKRGETVLVGNRLFQLLGVISAIHIVFTVISTGKIDFFANLYRFAIIFAVLHSCSIVYMFFLEKNLVNKFRNYLIEDGIKEKKP